MKKNEKPSLKERLETARRKADELHERGIALEKEIRKIEEALIKNDPYSLHYIVTLI